MITEQTRSQALTALDGVITHVQKHGVSQFGTVDGCGRPCVLALLSRAFGRTHSAVSVHALPSLRAVATNEPDSAEALAIRALAAVYETDATTPSIAEQHDADGARMSPKRLRALTIDRLSNAKVRILCGQE